jgi:methylated-DNA-[protein]-cysteine S-methyltransferase
MPPPEATAARIVDSPIGPLTVRASARGITALRFGAEPDDLATEAAPGLAAAHADAAADQLHAYFKGRLRDFTVPLDLRGTPFQLAVWSRLLEIPYGRTISYRRLAELVGSPQGFRAVGAANGANPVAIIVPCHRVIANDGTLGGYGGGLDRKRLLLELEGRLEPLFAGVGA